MRGWLYVLRVSLLLLCVLVLGTEPVRADASALLDFNSNNINNYRPNKLNTGTCSGLGASELQGHKLPATKGGTGYEEEINNDGRIKSKWGKPASEGGWVTFSDTLRAASETPTSPGAPSLKQLYMDYYITMRWSYVSWNWNGTSGGSGPEDKAFYAKAPRVLVTNPRTKKSIVAVVLEAGPGPWTGVTYSADSPIPTSQGKPVWTNPTVGTPDNYLGRVAGFPPKAIEALGATQRMQDGSGDELVYSWAPNQGALPGPVAVSSAADDAAGASACSGRTIMIDGLPYAFPVAPQTKISYSTLPCDLEIRPNGCHHDGTPAFDLMYGADGALDGKEVYAITDGTIINVTIPYTIAGTSDQSGGRCRALQFKSTAEYGGMYYWYGHIKNVNVKPGDAVRVGDKIAEVADFSYGNSCRGGRDHLHIDRGCKRGGEWQTGGYDECRDLGFVVFLNRMWEMLGN